MKHKNAWVGNVRPNAVLLQLPLKTSVNLKMQTKKKKFQVCLQVQMASIIIKYRNRTNGAVTTVIIIYFIFIYFFYLFRMNSRLLFFEKYHNYKIGDRQIRVGDEESDFPGFGGKFTRLMHLEKTSLIKNVRFGFILDNLETRLSLSDSRTKIKFKVGLDENNLVEIQPKNSFLDPDKMSFVFEGEFYNVIWIVSQLYFSQTKVDWTLFQLNI